MSQPRRRRRRRRRGGDRSGQPRKPEGESQRQGVEREQAPRSSRRGRGRKGRTRQRGERPAPPLSSEDIVRGGPKKPPKHLTAPHDGTTLEQVIGDLQSQWGVPQHPQEYRITVKVADERDGRERTLVEEIQDPEKDQTDAEQAGKPKREKAPAAPRIGSASAQVESGQPNGRKRGSRRRRRGRKR